LANVWDFGEETVGSVEVVVRAEGAGVVDLFSWEDLPEALRDEEYTATWYKRPRDRASVEAGETTVRNEGRRAFRFLRIDTAGPVEVVGVSAILEHYPVERRGAFECSDPRLNRIWEVAERTTRLCMQRYYEDGVKRDGLLWVGDYRIQFLCNAYLYGDVELARRSLRMIAASALDDGFVPACAPRGGGHQHPLRIGYMPGIPAGVERWVLWNFCFDFLSSIVEYLAFTGDRALVDELWPAVRGQVRAILDATGADDWMGTRDYLTDSQPDQDSWWKDPLALQAQLVAALADAESLAGLQGDEALGQELAGARERAARRYAEMRPTAERTWHSAAWAVLAGLEGPEALRALAGTPARYATSGYAQFWGSRAFGEAGLVAEALEGIRRYHGHMLAHDATTFWDVCDVNADGIDRSQPHAMSQCHGWTAGPAAVLPAYVLGVRPSAPGFATFDFDPQLAGLEWARGTVPSPFGSIAVELSAGGGSIEVPAGTSAQMRAETLGPGRHDIDL
jgi:hypothetical protein